MHKFLSTSHSKVPDLSVVPEVDHRANQDPSDRFGSTVHVDEHIIDVLRKRVSWTFTNKNGN